MSSFSYLCSTFDITIKKYNYGFFNRREMIGSNMVQSVLMLGLTPNICLYDIYEPGVHGVYDEMCHCAFPGANISYTVDAKEAFTGAKYIISSGGAPRKEGMTREDLLKGNCQIAADFGENIKKYCPDVKHVVVIFNPADVTALTALIHSGLKPNQLTSLAALDSTRLQQQLAQEFGVRQDKVTNAYTYGGHGEQMAVFASKALIDGKPLSELPLSAERWAEIKHMTTQGGSNIIKLRGRSSFLPLSTRTVFTSLSLRVLLRRWLRSRLRTSTCRRCATRSSRSVSSPLSRNGVRTTQTCKRNGFDQIISRSRSQMGARLLF